MLPWDADPGTLIPRGRSNHQASMTDDYTALRQVLDRAVQQASQGKGLERHANGEPFEDQQICQLGRWLRSADFEIGQACKKAIESKRLPPDRAVAELLGAIVYLAAAVVLVDEGAPTANEPAGDTEPVEEFCPCPGCTNPPAAKRKRCQFCERNCNP